MQRGFSTIIPARNEAAVIERNQIDRPLRVIVVANGCKDRTAETAHSRVWK